MWISEHELEAALVLATSNPPFEVTFDDGNASDVEVALPSLLRRNISATFFVCAGRVDTPGYLSADDVRALVANGMQIGSHGWSHRSWRGLDAAEAEREWFDARRRLQDLSGQPVPAAACPFGDYDRRSLGGLRAAGFTTVYTSDRLRAPVTSRIRPRYTVRRGEDPAAIVESATPSLSRSTIARAKAWLKSIR